MVLEHEAFGPGTRTRLTTHVGSCPLDRETVKAEWQTTRRHVTEVLAKRRQIVCSLVLQPSLLHVLSFLLSLLYMPPKSEMFRSTHSFSCFCGIVLPRFSCLGFARRSKTRLVASEFANQIEYGPTSHIELHVNPNTPQPQPLQALVTT